MLSASGPTVYALHGEPKRNRFSALVQAGRRDDAGAEELHANARLISAAPELLEALNDLLEAVDSMRGTYGCIQGRHPEEDDTHIHDKWAEAFLDERATLARAAIAKATGEQS